MKTQRRFNAQLLLGIIVIAVGVIFTLDNFNYLDASEILRYWPALLVIYGVTRLVQACTPGDRFWGGIVTVVGGVMLANRLGFWHVNIWAFWPLLLVALGASLIWRSASRRPVPDTPFANRATTSDSYLSLVGIMSGYERVVNSTDFRGGDVTAIMGGVDLDLRKAVIREEEAVLDVFAFWGGVSIKVPENWSVVNESMPIMGGIDDKTYRPAAEQSKRLIIRGNVVMGGVEIRN